MENAANTHVTYKRLKDIAGQSLVLENWYQETFFPDFVMEYHSHPQIEIMYCENGSFDFVCKLNETSKESYSVTVNRNCFIIVNNGYYHKLANLSPLTKIVNLEFLPYKDSFKGDVSSQIIKRFAIPLEQLFSVCQQLKRIIEKDKNYYLFVDSKNVLNTMKEIIEKTAEEDGAEKSLSIALLTTKLFLDISHCVSPESQKKTGIIYVDAAMAYINAHFLNKITINQIAESVGISAVYLQKLFKIQYGKTVHDVITEKRIMQAKYLIQQSNLSINEVAYQCGYGCREQLAYEFQKTEKCSPSKYRKKNSGKNIRSFSHFGERKLLDDEE